MPEIHPLVDLNNCLSAELAVPCCVLAEGTFEPPYVMRAGQPGESYESLRGPFNLEANPCWSMLWVPAMLPLPAASVSR